MVVVLSARKTRAESDGGRRKASSLLHATEGIEGTPYASAALLPQLHDDLGVGGNTQGSCAKGAPVPLFIARPTLYFYLASVAAASIPCPFHRRVVHNPTKLAACSLVCR